MSIQFNVATLLKEPVGSTRDHEIAGRVLINDMPEHRQIVGRAVLLRTDEGLLVTVTAQGEEPERCSRCARDITVPITIQFAEEFLASIEAETGATVAPREGSEGFRVDSQQVLDLEEAIRQSWAVALPMQPLCRADCQGLCSRCGQDLNEKSCSCPPDEDERWSALRQLTGKMEGT